MKKSMMPWLYHTTGWLTIIGGLNWGLIGAFDFNLVEAIFGTGLFTNIVYGLVGVSAVIYAIYKFMGE